MRPLYRKGDKMTKKAQPTLPKTSNKVESDESVKSTNATVSPEKSKKKASPDTPIVGAFADKMQKLLKEAEVEQQELDALSEKNKTDGSKNKDSINPEDWTITRPPSYGKLVAECLNYG